jgi:ankyrin repeat protein
MIASLLERGADINLRDKDGKTALEVAQSNGHMRCVVELQQAAPPLSSAQKESRRQRLWYTVEEEKRKSCCFCD